tara:strand:- start:4071 stop:4712 length:642 start_codon:yes stop_codon:yes gene_type:complete
MLRVALTGGIGSGKTAVSNYLETLGVMVLDADRFAHQVTAKGEDAVTEIANVLGPAVIDADGHLDRATVRELVFTDPKKRAALESIVHPRVRRKMNEAASQATGPYVIFSIPLLIETGQAGNFDRVVVVEAARELRAERVLERSGLDQQAFSSIDDAQASDVDRRNAATDILNNNGSLESLHAEVNTLHEHLTALSGEQGKTADNADNINPTL